LVLEQTDRFYFYLVGFPSALLPLAVGHFVIYQIRQLTNIEGLAMPLAKPRYCGLVNPEQRHPGQLS